MRGDNAPTKRPENPQLWIGNSQNFRGSIEMTDDQSDVREKRTDRWRRKFLIIYRHEIDNLEDFNLEKGILRRVIY